VPEILAVLGGVLLAVIFLRAAVLYAPPRFP